MLVAKSAVLAGHHATFICVELVCCCNLTAESSSVIPAGKKKAKVCVLKL